MLAILVASFALFGTLMVAAPVPAAARSVPGAISEIKSTRTVQHFERLIFRGTTAPIKLRALHAGVPAQLPGLEVERSQRGYRERDVHPFAQFHPAFTTAAIPVPIGPNRPVVPADPDFFAFAGLTHLDQRDAGTGAYTNTQFSLEPPDQGMCAGNGFVLDAVNNAIAAYASFGTRLTEPTPLSQFFGLNPEINRTTGIYGQFISDPKCLFDRDTRRWFITELGIDTDPATGNFGNRSVVLIAVSQTADPTGSYNVYAIDTTDAANPGCPCFGDQPLIGADANGFFVSTNEFPLASDGFNGSQIYALSKRGLTTGRGSTVVHIDVGGLPTPDIGGEWYSIQPATAPDTSSEHARNGTEFFLSSLDFFNLNDNRIAAWAVTDTATLSSRFPAIGFQHVVVPTVAYAAPPNAHQEPGYTPLADSLKAPLEDIDTNDDRMNQVVYAAGRLWSGVNTAVRSGSKIDAGIAFFAVAPGFDRSGFLTAQTVQQGYVAVAGQNMFYPSIGVNAHGGAVMTATLAGPKYYPTAVYVTQNGKVHIAGAGSGPDDGFTGYPAYGGAGSGRWGDYSAAVAVEDGSIWVATENIPGPRSLLANWGTFFGHVQIHN